MHIRRLQPSDIYALNRANLDPYTENFGVHFYNTYLTHWPDLCLAVEAADGTIAGYMISKMEGHEDEWHAHLSAISVATEFRGLNLTANLLDHLHSAAKKHKCTFVDLFVKSSNIAALDCYYKLGYKVARELPGYYKDGHSALELRLDLI